MIIVYSIVGVISKMSVFTYSCTLYTNTTKFAWDIMMVNDCSAYEKQKNIEIDIFFKNLSMASVIGENGIPERLESIC